MESKTCLLLVDLQNEFLSPEGNFPIHESSRNCLDGIHQVVRAFHRSGDPIFWIRSEYSNPEAVPPGDNWDRSSFLTGTHTGRKSCCKKGSFGAEFPPEVSALIAESPHSKNIIITKTSYSAFKETSLLTDFRRRGITDVYVGGVVTNVCVIATVTEACGLAFNISVLEDCLGWRKWESHEKALENMRELGVRVVSSDQVVGRTSSIVRSPVSQPLMPKLYYVNGSIPSWRVMMALYEKGIEFEGIRLKVMTNPKETRLPAFLSINHRGKTPVFVDVLPPTASDVADVPTTINVNESLAILQYIETYHHLDRPLLPPLSQRASRALVLCRIQETENLHNAYDALEDAHFDAANSGGTLDDVDRAHLIQALYKELDYWEVYAGKTRFIAGDEFGLADCAFFPLLAYMLHRGFEWRRPGPKSDNAIHDGKQSEIDAWPDLKAYFGRVWNRGGENGCAQRAQPAGWNRRGKANIWKGTKGHAQGLRA